MAFMTKKTEANTDFSVSSVGVCLCLSEDKKRPPCLVVAYSVDEQIRFVASAYSAKKEYDREGLLAIIAKAEGVKNVTYLAYDGAQKDIYVCREGKGKVVDFVPRDYSQNRFIDGFAEILASKLKFKLNADVSEFSKKFDKVLEFSFNTLSTEGYPIDSYEYAIVNAYNACLLGGIFEREELQLETKAKKKVRIEVRNTASAFVEQDVLYLKPTYRGENELLDYYVTEEFQRIGTEDAYNQTNKGVYAYKISYIESFKDYNLRKL